LLVLAALAAALIAQARRSRVRAAKARRMLDWSPQGPPLLLDIEHGSYRRAQAA